MLSVKNDLTNLPEWLERDIKEVGGPILTGYIDGLRANPEVFKTIREPKLERKFLLRAHGLVNDTEGKTRIIAMADYWSQTALRPLHDKLLRHLGTLGPCDTTFGQSIQPFGDSSQPYYSYDLTSATDRIPRFLYVSLLEAVFGPQLSMAWERIMIGIGYHGPDGIVRKYGTGQPMGLYSSWPLLALVHHAIVRVAARSIGLRRFDSYRILGDDIVIRHKGVAGVYASILRDLGIGISKTKTLVSNDTFEFAKRLFFRGTEVTAAPIHGMAMATKIGWQDVYGVLDTASKRNLGTLDSLLMPQLIEGLYTTMGYPFRIGRTAHDLCRSFHSLTKESSTEDMRYVLRRWKLGVGCTTDTKLAKYEISNRYLVELTSVLQSAYYRTLDQATELLDLEESEVEDMLYDMEGPSALRLYEPLAWCMITQLRRIKHTDLRPEPDNEELLDLDAWARALRAADVRILDPKVLDRTRKHERISRLLKNCATKAFAREALELRKLLHIGLSGPAKAKRL